MSSNKKKKQQGSLFWRIYIGVVAVALSGLLLDEGEAARALELLRAAEIPSSLAHAAAVLETRALRTLGRDAEAAERWSRYLEARKGAARQWTV